jgi:hypothetical protein
MKDCLFTENQAEANLMSIKESIGKIEDSTFSNNKAFHNSRNIFTFYSNVNITNCIFDDFTVKNNHIELVKTSNILGSYIFVSLGVNLYIEKSFFSNGISDLGGAIYITGLSTINMNSV